MLITRMNLSALEKDHLTLSLTAIRQLKIELDMCWASVANADVYDILKRYRNRIPLVHVKDCKLQDADHSAVFTELGKGVLDWPALLPAAKDVGAQWFIVEQDESEGDSVESARQNALYMQRFNQS